jgi:hypothetical protein
MRSLLSLIEQRRELVGDKTRFTNRLTMHSSSIVLKPWDGSTTSTRCCFVIS